MPVPQAMLPALHLLCLIRAHNRSPGHLLSAHGPCVQTLGGSREWIKERFRHQWQTKGPVREGFGDLGVLQGQESMDTVGVSRLIGLVLPITQVHPSVDLLL